MPSPLTPLAPAQVCKFRPASCPHPPCAFSCSDWRLPEHDARCPSKMLDCTLGCGHELRRGELQAHTAMECLHRPVPCPYEPLGCVVQ
eukprot:1175833-Pyramimonas_sp.AAC.1